MPLRTRLSARRREICGLVPQGREVSGEGPGHGSLSFIGCVGRIKAVSLTLAGVRGAQSALHLLKLPPGALGRRGPGQSSGFKGHTGKPQHCYLVTGGDVLEVGVQTMLQPQRQPAAARWVGRVGGKEASCSPNYSPPPQVISPILSKKF